MKPKYIPLTEEQIDMARNVDLAEYMRAQGEELKRCGSEWRWQRHDSVTIKGNKWFRHSTRTGGDTVEFLREFQNMSFPEAVTTLLGSEGISFPQYEPQQHKPKAPFVLPERNDTTRRVYAYLVKERGIDPDVVSHFVRAGTLYEDAQYHNAVFVGADESGQPRHAHKVSTYSLGKGYRGNVTSSDPHYGFCHFGTSNRLYAFEAPIDMLSFLSIYKKNWQDHSYIDLNGVGSKALVHALKTHPHIQRVGLCLDNDPAGLEAIRRIANELGSLYFHDENVFPVLSRTKDWNNDLQIAKGILAPDVDGPVEEPHQALG